MEGGLEQYTDDVKMIADMLKNQWSLGPQNYPNVEYIPEKFVVNARVGSIFVYQVSRNNQISSTDYESLQRTSNVSIKVSNRFRENHFKWCNEVYRILLANRRKGQRCMNGWLFLEVLSDRPTGDLSGWYTTTFDVRLTTYAAPIADSGLGDTLNKELADSTN